MQKMFRSFNGIILLIIAILLAAVCNASALAPSSIDTPNLFEYIAASIGLAPENAGWVRSISITDAQALLQQYELELQELRSLYQTHSLPQEDFFFFGMGNRRKMVYRDGALRDSLTQQVITEWNVSHEVILPPEYLVVIETENGELVHILEDEQGIWVAENDKFRRLSAGKLSLPQFQLEEFPRVMRVLHQEVLINIVDGYPSPNYLVYSKPWYRDAAVMAMVLQETNNLHLIRSWIEDIREPFDRNNAGIQEPDNLGQVLFLVSLVSDENHPVVPTILQAIPAFEKDGGIEGLTDFSPHAVYQTLWLKFGLAALGLPDPYRVPDIKDNFASLFWMAFRDLNDPPQNIFDSPAYPYLTTAQDHFFGTRNGSISNRDYPLTWESLASAARYEGMAIVSPVYADQKTAAPHGWHAAEWFLLLRQE